MIKDKIKHLILFIKDNYIYIYTHTHRHLGQGHMQWKQELCHDSKQRRGLEIQQDK